MCEAIYPHKQTLCSEYMASAQFQLTVLLKDWESMFFGIRMLNEPTWNETINYGKYV